jgi:CRISPR-associated endonuclease Cas3-HD
VVEHLEGVAALAARFVSGFCDPAWGRLAGQWHDLGKFSREFQQKIRSETGFDDLADILVRVQSHPASRIDDLLPHNWKPPTAQPPA